MISKIRQPIFLISIILGAFIFAYRSVLRYYDECSLLFIGLSLSCIVFLVIAFLNAVVSRQPEMFILTFLVIAISIYTPRIIPEKTHLATHRADYNSVIDLARKHKLGHEGICQYAFVLPEKYSYLALNEDKCIFVEYEPNLVVVFEPLFSRNLLVYAETEEALNAYISCGGSDGYISDELEEHWYICRQDWN